jgi:hypothetical protein
MFGKPIKSFLVVGVTVIFSINNIYHFLANFNQKVPSTSMFSRENNSTRRIISYKMLTARLTPIQALQPRGFNSENRSWLEGLFVVLFIMMLSLFWASTGESFGRLYVTRSVHGVMPPAELPEMSFKVASALLSFLLEVQGCRGDYSLIGLLEAMSRIKLNLEVVLHTTEEC